MTTHRNSRRRGPGFWTAAGRLSIGCALAFTLAGSPPRALAQPSPSFRLEEATITDIQQAILAHKIT